MSEIRRQMQIKLYGSADTVVVIEDGWEGMDLGSIRFGALDDSIEGGVSWNGDEAAFEWSMARAIAAELIRFADLNEKPA